MVFCFLFDLKLKNQKIINKIITLPKNTEKKNTLITRMVKIHSLYPILTAIRHVYRNAMVIHNNAI